jgi:tetratricopeptide (TPR) repeat protein
MGKHEWKDWQVRNVIIDGDWTFVTRNSRLLIVLFACAPLFAQVNPHERLKDALVLQQQGHFNKAITVAELLTDSNQLAGVELGRAYLILGSAYRIEGRCVEAQAAFESSLRILSGDPANVSDYALALDNYAGLARSSCRTVC